MVVAASIAKGIALLECEVTRVCASVYLLLSAAASRSLLSGCEGQSLASQSVTAGLFSVNRNRLILDNTNLSS